METITEYVYPDGTTFDWILEDDRDEPGVLAPILGDTPTRLIATLTPTTGAAIVLDTDAAEISLSTDGSAAHFMWDNTTATLTHRWGDLVPDTLPEGSYLLSAQWFDVIETEGVHWAINQRKIIVVKTS